MEKYKSLSKFLAMVLRHKPEVIGIRLDRHGWCEVDELIKAMQNYGKMIDRDILKTIVETDRKQRYSFDDSHTRIRANQGHSIHVDLELEEVKPPDVLYHGTVESFVDSIFQEGLVSGDRQYVHLSKDIKTATAVGSRRGIPVILRIDTKSMYEDGFKFYLSANGVWLCDYVPGEYICVGDSRS